METLSDSSSSSSVSESTKAKLLEAKAKVASKIQHLFRTNRKRHQSKTTPKDDGVEETKEPSPSDASRDRKSRAKKKNR
tara:strand:+ start:155 stop:391 length:237 start_codon:yes stop_codon:yes gene_type:complete